MPSSCTTPHIFKLMNATYGAEIARGVVTELDPRFNFSRVSADSGTLFHSYRSVMEWMGTATLAIPRAFRKDYPLVNQAIGHGFVGDAQNPNPSGMGLAAHKPLMALAVPYADAPSATIIHPTTGVIAAVSGVWTALPYGTVTQTLTLMKRLVEALGQTFAVEELWANLSPGARSDTFFIDADGRDRLLDGQPVRIFADAMTPSDDPQRPFGLDLSDLFRKLWIDAGINPEQMGYDARNTMTAVNESGEPVLPSKRIADALDRPGYASAIQAICWTGRLPY